MVNIRTKHLLHCTAFVAVIVLTIRYTTNVKGNEYDESVYSWPIKMILHFLPITQILHLSFAVPAFLGLILYDCFPDDVELKANLDKLPTICFRIVTKGNFPKLILKNLRINMKAIQSVKLKNFKYEIVTENHIEDLKKEDIPQVSEMLVPSNYRTKNGTLFKARNLQYCLEDGVNTLNDHDWIVHLDEDTILTENAVKGAANFIEKNEHCFGHGVVDCQAYGFLSEVLENAMVYEYGEIRLFSHFNMRPYSTTFRNVFLLARVDAEKRVSFDVGTGQSLLEDIAFGMLVRREKYTYGFVEGNVIEQAPTKLCHYIQSRIRCSKGMFYIMLRSSYFSAFENMMYFMLSISIVAFLLAVPALICGFLFPVNVPQPILILKGFIMGVALYQQAFIVIKNKHGSIMEYILYIVGCVIAGPILSMICYTYILFQVFISFNYVSFYNTPKRLKLTQHNGNI